MATSTALQAAMQASPNAAPSAGGANNSDTQNAALLASIAGSQPKSSAQNSATSQAIASAVGGVDQATPKAAQQQFAGMAAAPGQLNSQITGMESGANNAYLGQIANGASQYGAQLQQAMPLVNALASAQVAQANNNYAAQQAQNQYNQNYLGYQNNMLQQQQSNPILYGNTQQQAAAQQQVAQKAQSDTSLSPDDKTALLGTLGNSSVYNYASALNYYNQVKSANPKTQYNDAKVMAYLNSYYGGAGLPSSTPVAAAMGQAVPATPGTPTISAVGKPGSAAASNSKISGQGFLDDLWNLM